MKTTQYLDAAKKALGIESDYALSVHLGFTRAFMSKLRTGKLVLSNTTAARIAEIIDVDPLKVIADMELERGTNDELWQRIARKVAAVVLVPLACGSLIAQPDEARADAPTLHKHGPYYTLQRFLAWLFSVPGFADGALPA